MSRSVRHVCELPNTTESTGVMARWCRENGIPVLHCTQAVRYSSKDRAQHTYFGSRRIVRRADELGIKPRFGGLALNQPGRKKKITVLIRREDLILFRLRFN